VNARQCGAGYRYSRGTPQNRMGEQHSSRSTCTAARGMGIDQSSHFGPGRDTSRVVRWEKPRWTRRRRRIIDWHVGAEDHSGPPGCGLRQTENRRGHQGARRPWLGELRSLQESLGIDDQDRTALWGRRDGEGCGRWGRAGGRDVGDVEERKGEENVKAF